MSSGVNHTAGATLISMSLLWSVLYGLLGAQHLSGNKSGLAADSFIHTFSVKRQHRRAKAETPPPLLQFFV